MKISVNAAAGGALIGNFIDAAKDLLEEMASTNYHWSNEGATSNRGNGKYEVDVATFLDNRVDASS